MTAKPAPPPKPVHLTLSARQQTHPRIPSQWNTPDDGGDDDDQFITARSTLSGSDFSLAAVLGVDLELDSPAQKYARNKLGKGELDEDGTGSTGTLTLRRPKSLAGAFNSIGRTSRISIYFDPSQNNPLAPPSGESETQLDAQTQATPQEEREGDDQSDHFPSTNSIPPTPSNPNDPPLLELPLPSPLPALSLHSFAGEADFGELSFEGNVELCIEVEDVGGGWSLGYELAKGEEGRGLIPRGWYALILFEDEEPPKEVKEGAIPSPTPATPPPPTAAALLEPVEELDSLDSPAPQSNSSPKSPLHAILSPPPLQETPRSSTTAPSRDSDKPEPEADNDDSEGDHEPPISAGGRSIGRNVIVSGILFEPTDSLFMEQPNFETHFKISSPTPAHGAPSIPVWEDELGKDEGYDREERNSRESEFDSEGKAKTLLEMDEVAVAASNAVCPELRRESSGDTIRPTSLYSQQLPTCFLPCELPVVKPEEIGFPVDKPTSDYDISAVGDLLIPLGGALGFSTEGGGTLTPVMEEEDGEGKTLSEADGTKVEGGEREGSIHEDAGQPTSRVFDEPSPVDFDHHPSLPPFTTTTNTSIFSRIGFGTLSTSAYSVGNVGLGGRAKPLSRIKSLSRDLDPKGKGKLIQDWILNGEMSAGDADASTGFFVDSGPTWREDDVPPFSVSVHSPSKRSSVTGADYTIFQLTTSFASPSHSSADGDAGSPSTPSTFPPVISVERRYSHFAQLYSLLLERYPIISIPSLPSKSYAGRFQEQFVETRRRDLERWLTRIARSSVLRSSEEVRGFLIISEDNELKKLLNPSKSTSGKSHAAFLNQVFHPEYNVDAGDAEETLDRFEKYVKASENGKGILEVEGQVGKVRENLRHVASSFRHLAHSMVRVVAGLALPTALSDEVLDSEEDPPRKNDQGGLERMRRRAKALCLQNEDGAYTWKKVDEEALSVSKAMQATAEAISVVGELFDKMARSSMLSAEETLRELAYPYSQHQPLLELHKLSLLISDELNEHSNQDGDVDIDLLETEEALARADTVLNITSAEIERAHNDRIQDLKRFCQDWLQSEIEFHEQATTRLRFALAHFEPTAFRSLAQTGPRLSSALERPPATSRPLPVPSNYGIPSNHSTVAGVVNTALLSRPVGVVGEVFTERVGTTLLGLRGAGSTGVVGVGLGIRGGSTTNEARINIDVTTGINSSKGRSAAEVLQMQGSGGTGAGAEGGTLKPSWRSSIFGTGRFW